VTLITHARGALARTVGGERPAQKENPPSGAAGRRADARMCSFGNTRYFGSTCSSTPTANYFVKVTTGCAAFVTSDPHDRELAEQVSERGAERAGYRRLPASGIGIVIL